MESEMWINEDGVDPSKLNKAELVNEIVDIGDFGTMADCIRHLYDIDKKLATQALLKVMTTDENSDKFGDRFYQAMFLSNMFSGDKNSAISYIKSNYLSLQPLVLAAALEKLTYDKNASAIRLEIKKYVMSLSPSFFSEFTADRRFKNVKEDFLNSF